MSRRELTFVLRLKSDAAKALRSVGSSFTSLSKQVTTAKASFDRFGVRLEGIRRQLVSAGREARTLGRSLGETGRAITTRLTAPLVLAGGAVLRTAGAFEQSLNTVQNVTGATAEQFQKLRETARELGVTTAFSAAESAQGFVKLAQAGLTVDQSLKAIRPSLNLAAAGQLSLAQASDIVTNIITGFRRPVDELEQSADILALTAQKSNTTIKTLGDSFSFLGGRAADLNQDFVDINIAVGALGNAGIKGSRAGRNLAIALGSLAAPTDDAQAALTRLDIEVSNADGSFRSILDIAQDLGRATRNLSDEARASALGDIFTENGGRAISALIGQQEKIEELRVVLQNFGGTAQRAADTQLKGFFGQLRQLRSAFGELAISIGDSGVLDFVTDLTRRLTEIVRGLTKTNPQILKFASIIVVALAAIGPLVIAIGSVVAVFGVLAIAVGSQGVLTTGLLAITGAFGGMAAAITSRALKAVSLLNAAFGVMFRLLSPAGLLGAIRVLGVAVVAGIATPFAIATAAVRAFTVAILANPFLAAAAAILIIAKSLFDVRDNTIVVGESITSLRAILVGAFDLIKEKVGEAVESLKSFADVPEIRASFEAIRGFLENLGVNVAAIANQIRDNFDISFQSVVNFALAMAEVVVDGFEIVGLSLGLVASQAVTVLKNISDNWTAVFNELTVIAVNSLASIFSDDAAKELAAATERLGKIVFATLPEQAGLAAADVERILKEDRIPSALGALADRGNAILKSRLQKPAVQTAKDTVDQVTTILGGGDDVITAGATFGQKFNEGFATAADDFVDSARNAATLGGEVFANTFGKAEDAILDFLETGEFSFKTLADTFTREISRIAVRGILGDIGSAFGFGDQKQGQSFLGSLFGKGNQATANAFVPKEEDPALKSAVASVQSATTSLAGALTTATNAVTGFATRAAASGGVGAVSGVGGTAAAVELGGSAAEALNTLNQATAMGNAQVANAVASTTSAVTAASATAQADAATGQGLFSGLGNLISSGFSTLASAFTTSSATSAVSGGGGGGGAGAALGGISGGTFSAGLGALTSLVGLGLAIAEVAEKGGVAGSNPNRAVMPASIFTNAQRFQNGGLVTGGSGGVDDIPAMLTRGERVLTRQQNQAFEAGVAAAGNGPMQITQNFNLPNVRDAKQFRESESQRAAVLSETLRRAEGRNL